ncbi:hypothetical protein E5206_10835 [Arthrobacter sp. PAMC25564]|uniref:hypothetical protein n=1 Tax=Arthrobacter sp. PAMC25564 TaxID=2565366 RepID=UPI0010A20348|nr:hypothetical protein [Arthrobacter sp. PAMC25564]QCB97357.1 hypothetical protein E5206_10835 [Arthrobacter sp. PAMC25564]
MICFPLRILADGRSFPPLFSSDPAEGSPQVQPCVMKPFGNSQAGAVGISSQHGVVAMVAAGFWARDCATRWMVPGVVVCISLAAIFTGDASAGRRGVDGFPGSWHPAGGVLLFAVNSTFK